MIKNTTRHPKAKWERAFAKTAGDIKAWASEDGIPFHSLPRELHRLMEEKRGGQGVGFYPLELIVFGCKIIDKSSQPVNSALLTGFLRNVGQNHQAACSVSFHFFSFWIACAVI